MDKIYFLPDNSGTNNGMYKHGYYGTRINHIWASMRTRCNCKTNKDYPNYGGRGIHVCAEWNDFMAFYEWAIKNGYNDKLTIERINVNGDYCPKNCKWISSKEQQSNKRNNVFIEYKGEKHTISEWSRITGLSWSGIDYRLRKGKPICEVLKMREDNV